MKFFLLCLFYLFIIILFYSSFSYSVDYEILENNTLFALDNLSFSDNTLLSNISTLTNVSNISNLSNVSNISALTNVSNISTLTNVSNISNISNISLISNNFLISNDSINQSINNYSKSNYSLNAINDTNQSSFSNTTNISLVDNISYLPTIETSYSNEKYYFKVNSYCNNSYYYTYWFTDLFGSTLKAPYTSSNLNKKTFSYSSLNLYYYNESFNINNSFFQLNNFTSSGFNIFFLHINYFCSNSSFFPLSKNYSSVIISNNHSSILSKSHNILDNNLTIHYFDLFNITKNLILLYEHNKLISINISAAVNNSSGWDSSNSFSAIKDSYFNIDYISPHDDTISILFEVYRNTTRKKTISIYAKSGKYYLSDVYKFSLKNKSFLYSFGESIVLKKNTLFCSQFKKNFSYSNPILFLDGLGINVNTSLTINKAVFMDLCDLNFDNSSFLENSLVSPSSQLKLNLLSSKNLSLGKETLSSSPLEIKLSSLPTIKSHLDMYYQLNNYNDSSKKSFWNFISIEFIFIVFVSILFILLLLFLLLA